ncbi:hypothetical protein B296_00006650 [Ensete ventricosum]|uniref:Uncharacterized protein n=1 Tax=Ensete ventricosum TaxID=4639 RepID=A0A426ZXB4_ENSVE|nr:hypothetical protein B296_00006650 [Ensete ventricosum]
MPNPWKKSRAGGGSGVIQFLAKLRLPDQGGSLIIKNRDSLRKPSRKKKLPPSNLDSSAFDPVTTPVMATPSNDGIRPDTTFANWPIPRNACERRGAEVLFQNDSPATLLARIMGIIGPIDQEMLAKGRDTYKYFTKNHMLYERNQVCVFRSYKK